METIKKAAASVVHSITDNRATMPGVMTMASGCPIAHNKNSLTAGPTGPVLMQDYVLQEKIGQFAVEKIPARNVHALGFGAHGTFTVTNDISKHSYAKVFSSVGKKTDTFVRFSGVFTEQGDPDSLRDLRGFAVKFYTEEGNWDVLSVNTPVFNARDMKVRCRYKITRPREYFARSTIDTCCHFDRLVPTQSTHSSATLVLPSGILHRLGTLSPLTPSPCTMCS